LITEEDFPKKGNPERSIDRESRQKKKRQKRWRESLSNNTKKENRKKRKRGQAQITTDRLCDTYDISGFLQKGDQCKEKDVRERKERVSASKKRKTEKKKKVLGATATAKGGHKAKRLVKFSQKGQSEKGAKGGRKKRGPHGLGEIREKWIGKDVPKR